MTTNLDILLDEAGRPAPAPATAADLRLNYDYDQIEDPEERQILKNCAIDIYAADRDYRVRIGQSLNVAKAAIKHGKWEDWVAGEFGPNKWAARTIRDFMAAGRLVETVPPAEDLPGKVQSLLGSAQNADIAPDVAEGLIRQDKAGEGSGRGGRVNEKDAKAAINAARGRSVYVDSAPPAPSSVPPVRPDRDPAPAPAGTRTYTGQDDDPGVEVFDLSSPAGELAPDVVPADNGAGLVSISLAYSTALELANAARGGVLDGFLMLSQVEELISILQAGLDRA